MADKYIPPINTGKPAATLIGFLTLLIIFYILLLPADVRDPLLEGENLSENGDSKETNELIQQQIGKLSYIQEEQINHYIAGAYLQDQQKQTVFGDFDAFEISKGVFGGDGQRKIFTITDLGELYSATITFQAPTRKGTLKISINGEIIYEGELTTALPKPIKIPKEYLKMTNILLFEVEGGFLEGKNYVIEDLKIIGILKPEKEQQAEQYFTISGAEMENFKQARLEFRAACIQRNTGTLNVELNGRRISSTTPACDSLNRIDVYKDDLNLGKNEIYFELEEGNARIESAKIVVDLKEPKGYTSFFTIEESEWEKIENNEKEVILDIEFIDDNLNKRLEVNINGRRTMVDQKAPHYTKDITNYVKTGNNYIQLQPKTEVTIAELEVRFENK